MKINHEETKGTKVLLIFLRILRVFVVDSPRRARHTSCRIEIPIIAVRKENCKAENDEGDVWQSRPTQLGRA
jgi:hypothetical protein